MICLNNFRTTIVPKSRKVQMNMKLQWLCFKILILLFYLPLKSSNEISPRDNEHDVLRNFTDYFIFINKFVMSRVCIHLTWTLKYVQWKIFLCARQKAKAILRCYWKKICTYKTNHYPVIQLLFLYSFSYIVITFFSTLTVLCIIMIICTYILS